MRGKYRNHEYASEPVQRFFCANAHAAHLVQRAFKRTALAARSTAQAQCRTAAFTMIGFRQVDELEIKSKCPRE